MNSSDSESESSLEDISVNSSSSLDYGAEIEEVTIFPMLTTTQNINSGLILLCLFLCLIFMFFVFYVLAVC